MLSWWGRVYGGRASVSSNTWRTNSSTQRRGSSILSRYLFFLYRCIMHQLCKPASSVPMALRVLSIFCRVWVKPWYYSAYSCDTTYTSWFVKNYLFCAWLQTINPNELSACFWRPFRACFWWFIYLPSWAPKMRRCASNWIPLISLQKVRCIRFVSLLQYF